jgi:hypothetical protein
MTASAAIQGADLLLTDGVAEADAELLTGGLLEARCDGRCARSLPSRR